MQHLDRLLIKSATGPIRARSTTRHMFCRVGAHNGSGLVLSTTVPPIWLCPSLLPALHSFSTSAVSKKNVPGRVQRSIRRQTKQEGERHRRQTQEFEQRTTRGHRVFRPRSSAETEMLNEERLHQNLEFRKLVEAGNIEKAFEQLSAIENNHMLEVNDVTRFAQMVHYSIRTNKLHKKEAEPILLKTEQWYRSRMLPGSPKTTLHLIAAYRDLGDYQSAARVWKWARKQEIPEVTGRSRKGVESRSNRGSFQRYTDHRTYGVALEILPRAGASPAECEEIFEEAPRRFAIGFSAYHLKPEACLQDVEAPIMAPGSSLLLLQGIMTARFIHGGWRQAYMALDTAFRLHPVQMSVSFTNTLSRERPLSEQYQVLCMILKAGTVASAPYITSILTDMGRWLKSSTNIEVKFSIVEAMLTLIRLCYAAKTQMTSIQLNIVASAVLDVLPQLPDEAMELTKGRDSDLVLQTLELFAAMGVLPNAQTARQVLPVAVEKKALGAIKLSLAMIPESEHMPSVDYSFLMKAHSLTNAQKSLLDVWDAHSAPFKAKAASIANDQKRSRLEWNTFVDALADLGARSPWEYDSAMRQRTYLVRVLEREILDLELDASSERYLIQRFKDRRDANDVRRQNRGSERVDNDPAELQLQKVVALTGKIRAARDQVEQCQAHDLHAHPIDQPSILSQAKVPEEWNRALFNELVLGKTPDSPPDNLQIPQSAAEDPFGIGSTSQPAAANDHHNEDADSKPAPTSNTLASAQSSSPDGFAGALSPTNLSLSTLRFSNFCSMNALLLEAAAFERIMARRVNEAVKEGSVAPQVRSIAAAKNAVERTAVLGRQLNMYREVVEMVGKWVDGGRQEWEARVRYLRTGDRRWVRGSDREGETGIEGEEREKEEEPVITYYNDGVSLAEKVAVGK